MEVRERDIADLAAGLRARIVERRRAAAAAGGAAAEELTATAREVVEEQAAVLPSACREEVVERIIRDSVGLGPLEVLLADPAVEEVMVNGPGCVYVERRGKLEATEVTFEDEEELRNTIERILAPLGRRVDELSPMVDARLADGSRVNVVIPPLAIDGPTLSIRRFGADRPGPDELVALGTLTPAQRDRLAPAVETRPRLLVSGGHGPHPVHHPPELAHGGRRHGQHAGRRPLRPFGEELDDGHDAGLVAHRQRRGCMQPAP